MSYSGSVSSCLLDCAADIVDVVSEHQETFDRFGVSVGGYLDHYSGSGLALEPELAEPSRRMLAASDIFGRVRSGFRQIVDDWRLFGSDVVVEPNLQEADILSRLSASIETYNALERQRLEILSQVGLAVPASGGVNWFAPRDFPPVFAPPSLDVAPVGSPGLPGSVELLPVFPASVHSVPAPINVCNFYPPDFGGLLYPTTGFVFHTVLSGDFFTVYFFDNFFAEVCTCAGFEWSGYNMTTSFVYPVRLVPQLFPVNVLLPVGFWVGEESFHCRMPYSCPELSSVLSRFCLMVGNFDYFTQYYDTSGVLISKISYSSPASRFGSPPVYTFGGAPSTRTQACYGYFRSLIPTIGMIRFRRVGSCEIENSFSFSRSPALLRYYGFC